MAERDSEAVAAAAEVRDAPVWTLRNPSERRDGIDAVGITRWIWNGKVPVTVESPVVKASAPDVLPPASTEFQFDAV